MNCKVGSCAFNAVKCAGGGGGVLWTGHVARQEIHTDFVGKTA
jgi:hypothetical protein